MSTAPLSPTNNALSDFVANMNPRLFLIASTFAVGLLLKFGAPLLPVLLGLGVAAAFQYKSAAKSGAPTR